MSVGVVDIGTNSMRLLITDRAHETGRWVEVTGLGRGVDSAHRLDTAAIQRTIPALERFGALMDQYDVRARRAIATSASRDADNREEFFDLAEVALGVRPTLIGGETEARYAFRGAVGDTGGQDTLVSDIGGGSTEFVTSANSLSIDIGSVRLTDRFLDERPASPSQIAAAREHVAALMSSVAFEAKEIVGVAGTWTSLSAIALELRTYDGDCVHGSMLTSHQLTSLIDLIGPMTLARIEKIPSLDPGRAPVILAGAIVAERVLIQLDVRAAKISERDTLDGVAEEMLALA